MKTKAQKELLKELSYDDLKNCFETCLQMKTENYIDYVYNLYECFNKEVDLNLTALNNYSTAYIYVKETQFEFLSLQRYYFSNITTNRKFSCCLENQSKKTKELTNAIINIQQEFNSKAKDYLLLKADLLKELKNDFFKNCQIPSFRSNMTWAFSQTDLIEFTELILDAGIVKNKNGKPSLQEAVDSFSLLFDYQVKDIHSKLAKARMRKGAYGTKLYKKLSNSLNQKMLPADN